MQVRENLTVGTVFHKAEQIFEYLRPLLAQLKQESFYTLLLNPAYQVIRFAEVSRGLLDEALVHPREVFSQAVQLRAAKVVLVHNHPSGQLTPSKNDQKVTSRLIKAGEIIGIEVLDHLIVGPQGYYSFDQNGLLQRLRE